MPGNPNNNNNLNTETNDEDININAQLNPLRNLPPGLLPHYIKIAKLIFQAEGLPATPGEDQTPNSRMNCTI
jgi:hypothetical protein